MEATHESHGGAVGILCVMAFLALAAVANIPDAQISTHAVERHGTDALSIWQRYQRGECVDVWRCMAKNRVIALVGDGMLQGGIITTCSGKPVTAYMAPSLYWTIKVTGYEHLGRQCQRGG